MKNKMRTTVELLSFRSPMVQKLHQWLQEEEELRSFCPTDRTIGSNSSSVWSNSSCSFDQTLRARLIKTLHICWTLRRSGQTLYICPTKLLVCLIKLFMDVWLNSPYLSNWTLRPSEKALCQSEGSQAAASVKWRDHAWDGWKIPWPHLNHTRRSRHTLVIAEGFKWKWGSNSEEMRCWQVS